MYSKFSFDNNLCITNFYLTIKFTDDLNNMDIFFLIIPFNSATPYS